MASKEAPQDQTVLEASSLSVTLWRYTQKRVVDSIIQRHVLYIIETTLKKAPGWGCSDPVFEEVILTDQGWECKIDLEFNPVDAVHASLNQLRVSLNKARLNSQKFKNDPYIWDEAPSEEEIATVSSNRNRKSGQADDGEFVGKDVPILEDLDPSIILLPHEIKIPKLLLDGNDNDIDNHPAFRGIYGRAAHARRSLRAISGFTHSALMALDRSEDEFDLIRNHVLLWGPPAGGKTRLLRGIRRLLPKGAYFTLDAPSATKAGIVKLFRTTFRYRCPPIVFVEEIEKVPPDVLIKWLGMLDERAELSKFTHFDQDKIKVNFLCIATCNDKKYLETILKGALGSRFGHQVYVPRPNRAELEKILTDTVIQLRGDSEWVDVCLELMEEFNTDDPREIKSWLDYGHALTNGKALKDLRSIYDRQQHDLDTKRRIQAQEDDDEPSDQDLAILDAARAKDLHFGKNHKVRR